jgi:hypothetical protein
MLRLMPQPVRVFLFIMEKHKVMPGAEEKQE